MAWGAILVRQRFNSGPDALASSGMLAFGDLLFGVAVFALVAVFPLGLSLYWLRAVPRFWSTLGVTAMIRAVSGLVALGACVAAGDAASGWILLAQFRIGVMPLNALALATCSLFAPQMRQRWLLLTAAFSDGAIFTGVVLMNFILPTLSSG